VSAVICVPSNRELAIEAAMSIARVYGRGLVDGSVTTILSMGDTYIDTARNLLVTYALDVPTEPSHLMWIDDDMILPDDAVAQLAAHDVDIVGGLYHQRSAPYLPVAYNRDDSTERGVRMIELDEDPHGLIEVDGLGLGATLVRLEIYLKMAQHFGDAWWHQVSSGRGEDIHFFARCNEMGIRAWLDTDLRCGHVGRQMISTTHYLSYRSVHPR
jgi:hypothetical protein